MKQKKKKRYLKAYNRFHQYIKRAGLIEEIPYPGNKEWEAEFALYMEAAIYFSQEERKNIIRQEANKEFLSFASDLFKRLSSC